MPIRAQATDDPQAMKAMISDLLNSSGFLDWRESGVYAHRADKVLPSIRETRANSGAGVAENT